jgi:hypothetical protein
MRKRLLLITVTLLFPVPPGLASFSEAYKAYELGGYTTAAQEFRPLRSDLERAVDSCAQSVHRDDPDFEAYSEGSSVINLFGTPESRFKFQKCMSKKGYPLEKKAVVPAVAPTSTHSLPSDTLRQPIRQEKTP